jgi:hypothetical protein
MKDQTRTSKWCSLLVFAVFLLVVPLLPASGSESGLVLEPNPRGLLVSDVEEGSFASDSGLMPGDIIREADFKPLTKTAPETFQDYLGRLQANGGSALLKVERSGKVIMIWMKKSLEFQDRIAFDQTRKTLETDWAKCESAWEKIHEIVRTSYLEGINEERKKVFDEACKLFQSAKNEMIATEIPAYIPEKAGLELAKARKHFISAAGISIFAARALQDDLSKGYIPAGTKRAAFSERQVPRTAEWEENWIRQFESLPGGYKSFYKSMLHSRGKAFVALFNAEAFMESYE